MNTEALLPQPESNQEIINRKVSSSVPWILGAATVVAGSLLINAWIRKSKKQETKNTAKEENTPSGITTKSIAIQLLPVATLFLKNWLKKGKTEKDVVTA